MYQFNFLLLLATLLAIALFAMQNANPASITLIPGLTVEAPLVVELLVAAGIGALFAWFYGAWMGLWMKVSGETRKKDREIREKEDYISELKTVIDDFEVKMKQLPPSKRAEAGDPTEVETTATADPSETPVGAGSSQ